MITYTIGGSGGPLYRGIPSLDVAICMLGDLVRYDDAGEDPGNVRTSLEVTARLRRRRRHTTCAARSRRTCSRTAPDILMVQKFMVHADVKTTAIYDRRGEKGKRAAVEFQPTRPQIAIAIRARDLTSRRHALVDLVSTRVNA